MEFKLSSNYELLIEGWFTCRDYINGLFSVYLWVISLFFQECNSKFLVENIGINKFDQLIKEF